jgi:hypothetical protein
MADLLRQLQQPHLGGDIPVMSTQLADLFPHGFPPVLDADPPDSPLHAGHRILRSLRHAGQPANKDLLAGGYPSQPSAGALRQGPRTERERAGQRVWPRSYQLLRAGGHGEGSRRW